jgi:hypothetical protein
VNNLQKNIIVILAIAAIVIIAGGVTVWVFTNPSQNEDIQNTPTPQITPTLEATPEPGVSKEQIRDAAIMHIQANHSETEELMCDLSWTGGRVETGLLGAEVYNYSSTDWTVIIEYPIIPNPIYTITVNYSANEVTVYWVGNFENNIISETTYSSTNLNTLTIQEQIRDEAMNYIKSNHSETDAYMQDLSWTGGIVDQGMLVGSSKYNYQSSGWNVTIQYPIIPNPIYTITIDYTTTQHIVIWEGTWQNGTIEEANYSFTP